AQEKSVIEVMEKCENIKIGLGIGSSFDYLIGFQKRSPDFFKNYGLEWLYRLITGPNKLKRFKRIYNAVFYFTYKVLTQK
ncbi:MAG: WecB/TagA/CpsF family glycosyltransferase, partial [Candidatus Gracilibacteria bacterium]|nr:WecB/TagA/CpsF family glycosyltransferase [Candidatus Gracilibacteria bacterium]